MKIQTITKNKKNHENCKPQKSINIIWEIKKLNGSSTTSFKGNSKEGCQYFKDI